MDNMYSPRFVRPIGLLTALLMLCLCMGFIGCGGGGSSSNTVAAPTITTQPTAQTVAVGSVVSLSVVASGSGLNYQWYKDATAVSGATGATYTISSAAATNAGTYYAIVTNSGGHVQSNSVTLTVSKTTGSGTVTVQ